MASIKKTNKKKDIKITSGVLHVKTTPNNTLIILTDNEGNKILGGGTGLLGYKGAKKDTPYAAEVLTKNILKEAQSFGLKEIGLVIKGIGMARDGVFKAINEVALVDLLYIQEATPIQFGGVKGVRPKRN
ncbi:MAG TPA: 30S ribosomal protein S11 [Candidatus Absconditabacterales bacterium]|nr:30S ribosomal protein S11 [Candidatus Absconditabacterales bacterium]HOQ79135.1 30S ribosomal protein S11 [Candidatus Absconditabacterales bacterium]HPK28210.1 30S ribosomal protein S11 [Candidatus Absconditabacterales bacterium]